MKTMQHVAAEIKIKTKAKNPRATRLTIATKDTQQDKPQSELYNKHNQRQMKRVCYIYVCIQIYSICVKKIYTQYTYCSYTVVGANMQNKANLHTHTHRHTSILENIYNTRTRGQFWAFAHANSATCCRLYNRVYVCVCVVVVCITTCQNKWHAFQQSTTTFINMPCADFFGNRGNLLGIWQHWV